MMKRNFRNQSPLKSRDIPCFPLPLSFISWSLFAFCCFISLGCSTTLCQTVEHWMAEMSDERWNWNWDGTERGDISAFVWRMSPNNSVTIDRVPTENPTQHLSNTSQERYRFANRLDFVAVKPNKVIFRALWFSCHNEMIFPVCIKLYGSVGNM
jgi:hypothetical protein